MKAISFADIRSASTHTWALLSRLVEETHFVALRLSREGGLMSIGLTLKIDPKIKGANLAPLEQGTFNHRLARNHQAVSLQNFGKL